MKYFVGIAAGLFTIALLVQWLRLPLGFTGVWMSPDETANAVSAVMFAEKGTFRLPMPIAKEYPWVFPRSFISLADTGAIVPVGFLGMPVMLSLAYKVIGNYGLLLFTPLFAFLTLWALWRILPETWSKWSRWCVLLVWMSFPNVIVYANRGDFSNLLIVCLGVWLWYLLAKMEHYAAWPLAGLALGVALSVRPPEALWLLPLAVFAVLYRRSSIRAEEKVKIKLVACVAVCLVLTSLFAYLGKVTYGKWFVSGYQVRPIALQQEAASDVNAAAVEVPKAPLSSVIAFDLHPKSIAANAWVYLLGFWWPWLIVVIVAGLLLVKDKVWTKDGKWVVAAASWTVLWLVGFYGNNLYQDHIGLQAAVGNSYLRYLLPFSIVAAVSAGLLVEKLRGFWSLRILVGLSVAFLVFFGQWTANHKDQEGMVANQKELARYADIREETRRFLSPGAVVLSDRSDKIFFPSFAAVSPMPKQEDIVSMVYSGQEVAIFTTTLDDAGLAAWEDQGLWLEPVFSNGNQSLYHVE